MIATPKRSDLSLATPDILKGRLTFSFFGFWVAIWLTLVNLDGSSDPRFQYCLGLCEGRSAAYLESLLCANIDVNDLTLYSPSFPPLDVPSRIFGWNQRDNCIYVCAHRIADPLYYRQKTALAASANNIQKLTFFKNKARVQQYYGKWPLFRVVGMQEFFSVLFSLGNIAAHVAGAAYFYKKTRHTSLQVVMLEGDSRRSIFYWFPSIALFFLVAVATWLASAVYHIRQTDVTLGLDYFFSMFFLSSALAFTAVRVFRLFFFRHQFFFVYIPNVAFLIAYAILIATTHYTKYHIYYGAAVSLAFSLLWLSWAIFYTRRGRRYPNKKKKHLPLILAFVFLFGASTAALGAFDFVPLGLLLDAHACWHLSSIPLTLLLYLFITKEVQDELARFPLESPPPKRAPCNSGNSP
jgi:post-GPI attachment to proteins factor 3